MPEVNSGFAVVIERKLQSDSMADAQIWPPKVKQNGTKLGAVPKREEAKPKQIKVNVGTHAMATAGAR